MMSRRAPDTSWPDQPGLARTGSGYPGIRPSTRPTILRRSWPQEMPGTSPGMTRRVGRSDGSHPQGRRRPQPAPPLRPLGGAPVRTRTGSAERDRASVLIERFPCLCTTLPFRHGRACPGHPYGRAPVKRPGGGRCPDTRNPSGHPGTSGHDEEGGPVGWIASPSMQTATACSPSPPLIHFPQAPGARGVRSLGYAHTRAAQSRRPGRFAARPPLPVLSRLRLGFPLSPLRPLGPEKEKGADTAFGPPPPFSGEGNRGSWAGRASAMKRADRRSGARDRVPRRMARRQASGARARR